MQAIVPIVVSITVVFLMWIVGLQLTLADFRRIAQRPKVSVVGVGMITRKHRPNLAEQRDAAFRFTSLLMIAVSVGLIILDQREIFLEHLGSVAVISTPRE